MSRGEGYVVLDSIMYNNKDFNGYFRQVKVVCNANRKLMQCDAEYLKAEMLKYYERVQEPHAKVKEANAYLQMLKKQFLGINWKSFLYTCAATTAFITICSIANDKYKYETSISITNFGDIDKIAILFFISFISTCINVGLMEKFGKKSTVANTATTCVVACFTSSPRMVNDVILCMLAALPFALIFCDTYEKMHLLPRYATLLERMEAFALPEKDNEQNNKKDIGGCHNETSTAIVLRKKNDIQRQRNEPNMTGHDMILRRKRYANSVNFVELYKRMLKKCDFEIGEREGIAAKRTKIITSMFYALNKKMKRDNTYKCNVILKIINDKWFPRHIKSALTCENTADCDKGKLIEAIIETIREMKKRNIYNGNIYVATQTPEFQQILRYVVPENMRKQWQEEGLLDIKKASWSGFFKFKLQPTLAPTLAPTMIGLQRCNIF